MKACVMSLSETVVKSKNRVEIPHFSPETLKALYKAAKNGDSIYDLELIMEDNPNVSFLLHTLTVLDFNGIQTIKQLLQLKIEDLLDLQGVSFGSVQSLYDCLAQYDKMVSIKKAFKKKEQGREILARLIRTHCHGKKFTTRKVVV